MFITHAQTTEELRNEVISDILRRIEKLYVYEKLYERSARGKAKVGFAVAELREMEEFWRKLEIISRPSRRRLPPPPAKRAE